jgi:hypothetical protein
VSYDVTFGYAGPEYPEDQWRNYTSNVSAMWADAMGANLGDLIDEHGSRNADLIPWLERGVKAMEDFPDHYRDMNPENGWGDYTGALAYLRWMLAMCRAVPEGTVRVWR